ncbi:hypothetical protein IRX65_005231 [Salmonella enterica]|nr:hypothetical protein [Salmonella enterica]
MSVKKQITFAPVAHRRCWTSSRMVATAPVFLNEFPRVPGNVSGQIFRALLASAAGLFPAPG